MIAKDVLTITSIQFEKIQQYQYITFVKLDINRNENHVFHKPIHLYEPLYISYWTHDRWAEKTLLKNLIIITLFCLCQDIEGNVWRGSFNGFILNVIVGNIFRTLIEAMHFMCYSLINECQSDEEQAIKSRVEYCYGLISIKLCFNKCMIYGKGM